MKIADSDKKNPPPLQYLVFLFYLHIYPANVLLGKGFGGCWGKKQIK